ncbi:hypothetical protein C475_16149 [Halosimplex carlsbadense 2-9-1]|uniref:Uncharacterized protein n=1 Tax=Halosimplex carlsbadense 2-9-1 TaxID=797114 RepID=M0CLE9_9EURY|nr:hypothetical protein C475_16149 [Halosimplex carlsbadense 2-9-1]
MAAHFPSNVSVTKYQGLVECLRGRVGESLLTVTRFTDEESEFLYGEEWFERFVAEVDTRSPEKMHQDAVYNLRQAEVSGKLYGSRVRSEVRITEDRIGIALYPGDSVGFHVLLDDEASVDVPGLVDEALAELGESA